MTETARRPRRQNIYLPERLIDYLADSESLSGRVVQIIDRYCEALERTPVQERFSAADMVTIRAACHGWWAEPAATIFGGLAMEVDAAGGPPDMVARLNGLSPWEQIALLEYIQGRD